MTIGRLTQQLLCTTNLGANEIAKASDGGGSALRIKSQISKQYLQLEPRVMFDGALAATPPDVAATRVEGLPFAMAFVGGGLNDI
jgi:hypothetical protein